MAIIASSYRYLAFRPGPPLRFGLFIAIILSTSP